MTEGDAATDADAFLDEEAERRIERCVRELSRADGPLFDWRAQRRIEQDPDEERERRRERDEDR